MTTNELLDLSLSGVKWEISDTPLAVRNTPQRPTQQNQKNRTATIVVPAVAPSNPISIETVKSMVQRPADIGVLIRMIAEFNHPLRSGATNVVLPHIAPKPNGVLVITDIPGIDDDATGNILSGGAGDLLDKMLSAIGMSRDNVSILPLLFWRTPGGRSPSREELDLARPFVNRCIDFVAPDVILTLGDMAASEIAGVNLGRTHGQSCQLAGGITVLPIYHPNYLILKPTFKREVWDALQSLQKLLKTPEK